MPAYLLVAAALLAANPPAPNANFETGRRTFAEGLQALDAGRIEAAISAFEASVAARESPPALYNLALAYRRADRLRDALQTFERYLDLTSKKADDPSVRHARALAEELRAALARLTVSVEGPARSLTIDGQALDPAVTQFGFVLDPGAHRVVAVAADGRVVERRAELTRGAQLDIVVDLAPPQPELTVPTPAPAPQAGPSPWWWVGLGVGLAVVAGGAAAVVLATRDADPAPPDGGTTGVVLRGLGGN